MGSDMRKDEAIYFNRDPLGQFRYIKCSMCGFEFTYTGMRRPMKCPNGCGATAKQLVIQISKRV